MTLNHQIFTRWPAHYPSAATLSLPTPNGVKVGIMLEETSLVYEPHRIVIMADESHDPAFVVLNPNGKILESTARSRAGSLFAIALLGALLQQGGPRLFSGFHMAMAVAAGTCVLATLVIFIIARGPTPTLSRDD
jgi:hypothetical protein